MPRSSARILYVDDDIGLCRLAQRALEREGFNLTVAHTGAEGVALAMRDSFDIVTLDHYMPEQDGLETLAQLQSLERPPAVIFVTGSAESSVAVAALKAGAMDYVIKSAGGDFFDLLAKALDQALELQRLRIRKEAAEQQLRESNALLEAMLGEMNHRVANSLQMVAAVVNLEARKAKGDEARALVQDIRHRIQAVAQVHRKLSVGTGALTIAMADYIAALASDLEQTFSNAQAPRPIVVQADMIDLPAGTAVTLGMLINELVTNACKYAYAPGEAGEVRIIFRAESAERFSLSVEDDGRGQDGEVPSSGSGLGSQIIQAMTHSLGARLIQEPLPRGFRATLVHPAD